MALTATVRNFTIELAHIDHAIYESLEFKVAQHPSENTNRVAVRVLARALEHQEYLEFGRGLSNVEEPALWSKSPQGDIDLWIDVGAPSAQRLHRANKQAKSVCVYTDKQTTGLRKEWGGQRIHQAEKIKLVLLPTSLTQALAERIDKQNTWVITVTDGYLNVGIGDDSFDAQLEQASVSDFM